MTRVGAITDWVGEHRTMLALALVILGVTAGLHQMADRAMTHAALARERAAAAATVGFHATGLGNAVQKRLALVRGVTAFATVESTPEHLAEEFPPFADALRATVGGVRNISLSPDFVVAHVNPVAGNQKVLGNNLLSDPRPGFADTVQRAIRTRDVTTHGPLPLIQGGLGLIARQVVFLGDRPWGAVGAVFDLQPILDEAGLEALSPRFLYAVRRADGELVAGDAAVLDADPLVEHIHIPDGDWQLVAAPVEGWTGMADRSIDRQLLAGVFLIGGVLLAGIVALLVERRTALTRLVAARTRDLDRSTAELAAAKDELEQFAYAAAHDLQEPVRVIASYAQLLRGQLGDKLDLEVGEQLTHLEEGSRRLKAQLRDVQLFVAEDRAPLPDGPSRADQALEAALTRLERSGRPARTVVETSVLPPVMADAHRLTEILFILVGNALEYRHPARDPTVTVRAERRDGYDILSVSDNGIGIEPEYQDQIFQVFRRLHGRDAHPGTGMGLAIARKMAARLGGRIAVRSQPGLGSTFSLILPTVLAGAAE